jgi:uracil-DNA glycosylase family 4
MDWFIQLDRIKDLEQLKQYCLQCQSCKLGNNSTVVFGEGNPTARLMLVGEAPGSEEERQQRPFVGAAGKLLNKILTASGIHREEIYITNIVKCRPPQNRDPQKEEADRCFVYLARQIELIQPKLIVCLGSLATKYLVHQGAKVTSVRGEVFVKGGISIIPTYHPAALLRDASKKKPVWKDFQMIYSLYRELAGK